MLLPRHEYLRPDRLDAGLAALAGAAEPARIIAGGTDVVFNMRCRLIEPATVVSLRAIPELREVDETPGGGLCIGACARLTDLAEDPRVRRYPAFVAAIRAVASRHVRNMATLGGNLCLDTRCWYTNQSREWREARGPCLKTGSPDCHVIRGVETCVALNNADTPPALIALGAEVTLLSAKGERRLPLRDFYRNDGIRHTVLEPGELLARVHLPPPPAAGIFIKQTARQGMDFAYGTVAAAASGTAGAPRDTCIVLGSLSTAPLVLRAAPLLFDERGLDDETIERACATLREELGPLTNLYSPAAYKRELARALLRRAARELREALPSSAANEEARP